ncbi:MAG: C10 family peptidase, partial [Muribaculaceae bacterium]|nr:C10 family peptidase [Muribaculaceae bacterium]
PFNNYCPTYDNGMTTYSGCVATAMAQMMYYHQWPPQGRGSNTYEDKVGDSETQTLSRDFSQSTYAWDDMLLSYKNGYTTAQANAVARLMSDCGIAVNMHYGSEGSGALTIAARNALVNNFDYDATTQFVFRSKCTGDEWE